MHFKSDHHIRSKSIVITPNLKRDMAKNVKFGINNISDPNRSWGSIITCTHIRFLQPSMRVYEKHEGEKKSAWETYFLSCICQHFLQATLSYSKFAGLWWKVRLHSYDFHNEQSATCDPSKSFLVKQTWECKCWISFT